MLPPRPPPPQRSDNPRRLSPSHEMSMLEGRFELLRTTYIRPRDAFVSFGAVVSDQDSRFF